ncbi:ABC transporter substrate-binding protein [Herbaspirillum sp. LeCh32-8]|uniref:ABC transporter substrate-binding protein n=1 Tax=Herbaspirillum sp. LeCh32-8 TaxID=2821356 RepID=UPI001AE185D1|nr:ABC transporter substrate-binding protein [Herbaspirillum sp. LeCh32-8]MBP0600590.1 ABC transporter substrate-binding protein [Herbaspirillum sp. LeCh32-8]
MIKLSKAFKIGVLACAMAASVAASAGAHAADVTIGALFPLSGPNASYGDIFGSGANLAAEHINADNLLGGKLSIQYEDSQALPQAGVIGMNKLVNVQKVPYVLSAFTGVSKAISTIATRTKTVAVNGGGVGPDLAELGQYFWNIIPLANYEVRAIIPYLVGERKMKNVVLVYVDDPLGQAIKKELESALPPAGGKLLEALSVPATAQQFGGIAARVRSANPDVIYVASYGSQQSQIVKQFRDNGIKQPFASYTAFSIPEINAQPEAVGSMYTSQNIDWNSQDPVTKRFVDDYKKKYNKMPTAYIANYYNAVRMFGLLAQQLIKKGQPITGDNLLKQRIETKTFDLVGGKVSFAENGTVTMPMQINEIDGKGGKVLSTSAK